MILSSITEAVRFLPSLNLKLANNRLDDFFKRAQERLSECVLGTELEETLEIEVLSGHPDPHAALRTLVQRVIAEMALLTAVPEMDLQLSEAGFVVQSNASMSPASTQRVARLIGSLNDRIKSDTDAVVAFLITHSGTSMAYAYWRTSPQFNYITSAFLTSCRTAESITAEPFADYTSFFLDIEKYAAMIKRTAAYYVSVAQIDTLLQGFRSDALNVTQHAAVRCLQEVGVHGCKGNAEAAMQAVMEARKIMNDAPAHFADYAASEAYVAPTIDLGRDKTANML